MFLRFHYKLKKTGDCSKTEKFASLLNQNENINICAVSTVIKMLMSMYVYTQIMEIKLLLFCFVSIEELFWLVEDGVVHQA